MRRSIIRKAINLTFNEWRYLLEASYELFMAWIKVKFLPFRYYVKELEQKKHDETKLPDIKIVTHIKYAINRFSKVSPFESRCLVKALAARRMLNRRNYQSTMYLGLARNSDRSLKAHAWLICQNEFVTGSSEYQQFTVIATYI